MMKHMVGDITKGQTTV